MDTNPDLFLLKGKRVRGEANYTIRCNATTTDRTIRLNAEAFEVRLSLLFRYPINYHNNIYYFVYVLIPSIAVS